MSSNAFTQGSPRLLWNCLKPGIFGIVIAVATFGVAHPLRDTPQEIYGLFVIWMGVFAAGGLGLIVSLGRLASNWGALMVSASETNSRRIIVGALLLGGGLALSAGGGSVLDGVLGKSAKTFQLAWIAALASLWPIASGIFLIVRGSREPLKALHKPGLAHKGDPERNRALGAALHALGVVVLLGGACLAVPLWDWTGLQNWPGSVRLLVFAASGIALLLAGAELIRRARRLRVDSAHARMAQDPRPPILFLRSFAEDGATREEQGVQASRNHQGRTGHVPLIGLVLAAFEIWRFLRGTDDLSFEEELARWFGRFGPFVAIGKPGEELATLGASRLYVSHDTWQGTVTELIASSQMIVWQAGSTEGTWWELERLVQRASPLKLALIAPHSSLHRDDGGSIWTKALENVPELPQENSQRTDFLRRIGQYLPRPLPDMSSSDRFIVFDAEWNASVHPLITRTWLEQQLEDTVIDLDASLPAIAERLRPMVATSSATRGVLRDSSPWPAIAGVLVVVAGLAGYFAYQNARERAVATVRERMVGSWYGEVSETGTLTGRRFDRRRWVRTYHSHGGQELAMHFYENGVLQARSQSHGYWRVNDNVLTTVCEVLKIDEKEDSCGTSEYVLDSVDAREMQYTSRRTGQKFRAIRVDDGYVLD
jgi:hypothetical protein